MKHTVTVGDSVNRAKTLLNEKEQAALLSISWRGLQEARKKRLIPHVRIGRRVLYRPSDVERALERLTVKEAR
jgi:hypothetical protein